MNNTLLSSYSGIKTHQFGLDSISNNIANVNTVGYRENRAEFETLFAPQEKGNASSPTDNAVNLGVSVASNAYSTKSGSYRQSDGEFHMAYQGKGWFVVGENKGGSLDVQGDALSQRQPTYFTRDGSFSKDHNGFLVNPQGYYLYGVNLGKIEGNVFQSSPKEKDLEGLTSKTLSPLQIPQDLQFKPVATTRVDLALNLNASNNPSNAYEVFANQGNIDQQKVFDADSQIFFTQGKAIDPLKNRDAVITLNYPDGKQEVLKFAYSTQATQDNQFRTLGDLKALLEKSGLDLGIKEDNGKLKLSLSNSQSPEISVATSGSFFEALGMVDEKGAIKPKVETYDSQKTYQTGDLVSYREMIFKKTASATSANPVTNPQDWELVDTSKVPMYQESKTYSAGDIVQRDGGIYIKNQENDFLKIGSATTMQIQAYNPQERYPLNAVVSADQKLYERVGEAGNSSPLEDPKNWREVASQSIDSKALEIPTYQSSTEIYDENGKKYQIVSHFSLVNGQNPQDQTSQKWEVVSYVADLQTGDKLSEEVRQILSFDEENKPMGEEAELTFNQQKITYNLLGSTNQQTTNWASDVSKVALSEQNGYQAGVLERTNIDDNGVIYLKFSNGIQEPMGRVGIMTFTNDQGLRKMGGNLFGIDMVIADGETQARSGKPILGWNDEGRLQFGNVKHGYLETSNVDVGNALTELILMQRGYAMNAKTFTTGDEMIKEAINLKR